ncbi:hypothetical protein E3T54_13075 [Cryobacterium sp. Sr8]|uniref:hypothetical protein n=1 Tax=Cryobacterium sp. Sr8 TaxID=1259203 RepID=UPI00106BFDC2|nr:hypothetical protein [Cryobacterium sp. Sr8]TFD74876.1 hypothetical protein E3T54_13075 [Cryobacterium sp. Sr8]
MDDAAFYENMGPWATQQAVRDALGVDAAALASLRETRGLVAVEFGRRIYYPTQQFHEGRVVDGLQSVLIALADGFRSPEAQVAWLAEPAYRGDSRTRWDVLRDGNADDVAHWAASDAAAALR